MTERVTGTITRAKGQARDELVAIVQEKFAVATGSDGVRVNRDINGARGYSCVLADAISVHRNRRCVCRLAKKDRVLEVEVLRVPVVDDEDL